MRSRRSSDDHDGTQAVYTVGIDIHGRKTAEEVAAKRTFLLEVQRLSRTRWCMIWHGPVDSSPEIQRAYAVQP